MKKAAILIGLVAMLISTAAGLTIQEDMPSLNVVFQGEKQVYSVTVRNDGASTNQYQVETDGSLTNIINTTNSVTVSPGMENSFRVEIDTRNTTEDFYTGSIIVSEGETEERIPLGVRVVQRGSSEVRLDIQTTSETVRPEGEIGVFTVVSSSTVTTEENSTISYEVRRSSTGERVHQENSSIRVGEVNSYNTDLEHNKSLAVGNYYVQGRLLHDNSTITATDTFQITNPFWTPLRIKIALFLVAGGIIMGGGFYTWRWYQERKSEEARYVFPVDYSKLPEGDELFEVGKIAETEKEAYIDPSDLTTHAIVAGSTGSGKSVTANVIAEEALEQDIPVVVFDPTAQWTGFVKELKDDDLKEHYERFDMDPETDPHPYRGIIKEVKDGNPDIDFQQLKQPGEITVFTLNQLTTEQFDDAVREIIGQIFEIEWEESPTLEMLIIFDEVHRLLEEYGGKGGYHALEKGAREFRKWGIGLMMASQVTADFKQAISGNIMTEVQMQTKSMEDINRVEKKYGEQFAKRISSEDVGTGMIQNSNYNDGDPWFVDFRPTYHNPHKIPDSELNKYHELSERVDRVRKVIEDREEQGEDMQDTKLELNLADNKLKEGRFKMTKMYIDTLEDELNIENESEDEE